MTKDCEAIAVDVVHPFQRRGPVFYASLPRDAGTREEHGTHGEDAKRRLVSVLWDRVAAIDRPSWAKRIPHGGTAFPIQLFRDPLGKPYFRSGALRGPSISFSEGGGKVWAALSGDDSEAGIDVAGADEFQGEYPFRRVFGGQELQHALELTDGDLQQASALLWSVKEAAVKALGCAFHLAGPNQIHVDPLIGEDNQGGQDGYAFSVRLSGKAAARFPIGAGRRLRVRSFPRSKMWLSVAVLYRCIEGHAPSRSSQREIRP